MCISSREFNELCGNKEILDKKALEYLQQNAPIAEPITSFVQQANRVQQGLRTYYYVIFRIIDAGFPKVEPIGGIRFGIGDVLVPREAGSRVVSFSIKGYPGKAGTRVHIAYVKFMHTQCSAYTNPVDAFKELVNQDINEYVEGDDISIIRRLGAGEIIDNEYAIISLPLP
jgi:hypothetical protein